MDTNAHSELDQDDLDSKEMKNEDNQAFHTGNEESERGTMEMFVNSENDNTEAMRDILLNRIKMEPNEYDWAECSGNNQGEFKADSCAVKEEVSIKKEDIEESIDPFDPDSHGVNTGHSEGYNLNEYAASKEEIKIEPDAVKSEMDIDSEDFKISEITEEFIIKSDGETSMDASSDAAPNRAKMYGVILWNILRLLCPMTIFESAETTL
ncbi:unnamed protein product [Acanthoscelides obtectus]|uniref:Uncharacterized protein n=1 Tax=Acanthoscelides obtectus TaxID=200917 RepID=A0A9P0L1G7_ACAOB|nr:unnamed protein product [Acanthoscelides obtectus]CAK1642336.1 hypothetical protein AOBTE_LOCUS12983 [Acanthoscelides obtectus]